MSFLPQMTRLQHALNLLGVPALTPDDVDNRFDFQEPDQCLQVKRSVSLSHMRKVQSPITYAVLVANFDKHGIEGYVGPNTFAEVAVAFAMHKTIYLLNVTPRQYADELTAWGVRELDGSLSRVATEYEDLCRQDLAQMRLPEF
jgi:hypothetical protein